MNRILLSLIFILLLNIFSCSSLSTENNKINCNDSLQAKFNSLKVGSSNFNDLNKLFRKPEKIIEGVKWHETNTNKTRTIYEYGYPSKGLSFSMLSHPSELYSITFTNNCISVYGINIGDTYKSIIKKLGDKGEWRTTDSQDWWWLEFEEQGLKLGFDRDHSQNKFPLKLAKPELVTKIEIYNNKLSFSGSERPEPENQFMLDYR